MGRYRKYFECMFVGARSEMEYRFNYIIGLLSVILPMILQFFLWTAIYIGSNKDLIHGYSYHEMIMYSVLAGLSSKVVHAGFQNEMAHDIKSGNLNKFLIQPISYFLYRIASFIGQKSQQLIIIVTLLVFTFVSFNYFTGYQVGMYKIQSYFLTLLMGTFLNFLIFFCIAMLAFWFNQIIAFFSTFTLVSQIAGGGVFPVEFFGEKVRFILDILPFKYTIYYPISIINERVPYSDIPYILLGQCIWIAIFMILTNVTWKVGIKKYVALGG